MNLCYVCHSHAVTGKNLCAACLKGAYKLRNLPVPEQVLIDARKCRPFGEPEKKVYFDPSAKAKHPKQLGRLRSSWSKWENATY